MTVFPYKLIMIVLGFVRCDNGQALFLTLVNEKKSVRSLHIWKIVCNFASAKMKNMLLVMTLFFSFNVCRGLGVVITPNPRFFGNESELTKINKKNSRNALPSRKFYVTLQ